MRGLEWAREAYARILPQTQMKICSKGVFSKFLIAISSAFTLNYYKAWYYYLSWSYIPGSCSQASLSFTSCCLLLFLLVLEYWYRVIRVRYDEITREGTYQELISTDCSVHCSQLRAILSVNELESEWDPVLFDFQIRIPRKAYCFPELWLLGEL